MHFVNTATDSNFHLFQVHLFRARVYRLLFSFQSADNPESLRCKVCNSEYLVERGSQFSLAQGFTLKHWLLTLSIVTLMGGSICGCWFVVQMYTQPWARMLAVGSALLVQYICLR